MVTIISKQDGPRKGEEKLKQAIQQNRGTIEQMARAIKHGPMAHKAQVSAPQPEPQASSTTISYRKTSSEGEARPYIRFSMNGRVVVVDFETGNQLHHIGDVRGKGAAARFVLATKENGFFAPVEESLREQLKGFDGTPVADGAAEDALKTAITESLGL